MADGDTSNKTKFSQPAKGDFIAPPEIIDADEPGDALPDRALSKRCVRVGARAAKAQAAALAEREAQARSRALDLLNAALAELAKLAAERGDAAPGSVDRVALRLADAIARQIEAVLTHTSSSSANGSARSAARW